MGADSRLVGVFVALVCLLAMTVGADALSYVPKLVLGGLVMFAGIGFLNDWVVQSWSRLSRSDMIVIFTILAVIETIGFLEGVAVGIGASAVLFILNYSRISVVRHAFSGKELQSNIDRPAEHRAALSEVLSFLPQRSASFRRSKKP
jgi:SulP family sulfate permease